MCWLGEILSHKKLDIIVKFPKFALMKPEQGCNKTPTKQRKVAYATPCVLHTLSALDAHGGLHHRPTCCRAD